MSEAALRFEYDEGEWEGATKKHKRWTIEQIVNVWQPLCDSDWINLLPFAALQLQTVQDISVTMVKSNKNVETYSFRFSATRRNKQLQLDNAAVNEEWEASWSNGEIATPLTKRGIGNKSR